MNREIVGPVEAVNELMDFLMERRAAIPDDVRDRLTELVRPGTSPVDAAVNSAELIYARREDLPPELLEIGAATAVMAAGYGFHGLQNDNRGAAIAQELRRQPGVAKANPASGRLVAPEPRNDLMSPEARAAASPPVPPLPEPPTNEG